MEHGRRDLADVSRTRIVCVYRAVRGHSLAHEAMAHDTGVRLGIGRFNNLSAGAATRQPMMWLAESSPDVSIKAEHLFTAGGLNVTNALLMGVIGWIITFWILIYAARRIRAKRYNYLSLAVLWAYDYLFDTSIEVLGDRESAKKLAPIAISMFFFIFVNNALEVLPVFGVITFRGVPLFRGITADLNFTFALAVITFVTAFIWAVKNLGFFGNLKRYFRNPISDFAGFFEGFLELLSEFSRFIALSMRLFGNIFGGEVLLAVMLYLSSWAAPLTLPVFMLFELFIGLIQAYIFFMLTVVFVSLGTVGHGAPASDDTESLEATSTKVAHVN